MENKKIISSGLTFFYKYILPLLLTGTMGFLTVYFLLNAPEKCVFTLSFLLIGNGYFFIYQLPLKRIEIRDNDLIISNYLKSISVPVSEIEKITENASVNIHPVWIHLKHKTVFGKKIMFMPRSFHLFGSHPIVKELYELANQVK